MKCPRCGWPYGYIQRNPLPMGDKFVCTNCELTVDVLKEEEKDEKA
jgi:hypothetical protein